MARPVYTVVINLDGTLEIKHRNEIPWESKGTSRVKAERIINAITFK